MHIINMYFKMLSETCGFTSQNNDEAKHNIFLTKIPSTHLGTVVVVR